MPPSDPITMDTGNVPQHHCYHTYSYTLNTTALFSTVGTIPNTTATTDTPATTDPSPFHPTATVDSQSTANDQVDLSNVGVADEDELVYD